MPPSELGIPWLHDLRLTQHASHFRSQSYGTTSFVIAGKLTLALHVADITPSSEGKLAVAMLNSPELRSALMTNSDGEVLVIVPRGRPSLSLNAQMPGLNFTGVTTTSTAASPSIQHNTTCLELREWLSSDVPEGSALMFSEHATSSAHENSATAFLHLA